LKYFTFFVGMKSQRGRKAGWERSGMVEGEVGGVVKQVSSVYADGRSVEKCRRW
jgi:hypothetical protein